jgi:hypothetical protein
MLLELSAETSHFLFSLEPSNGQAATVKTRQLLGKEIRLLVNCSHVAWERPASSGLLRNAGAARYDKAEQTVPHIL